jgi:hypothetical protein
MEERDVKHARMADESGSGTDEDGDSGSGYVTIGSEDDYYEDSEDEDEDSEDDSDDEDASEIQRTLLHLHLSRKINFPLEVCHLLYKYLWRRSYITQFNGNMPYKVVIDAFAVEVFQETYEDDEDKEEDVEDNGCKYTTSVLRIDNPYQVFIGKSKRYGGLSGAQIGPEYDGNSILIRPSKDKLEYIFIHASIMRFCTDSPVFRFHSPMGNNNVPYPYAITGTKLISLVEMLFVDTSVLQPSCVREYIKATEDPHIDVFYDQDIECDILEWDELHQGLPY